MRLALFPMETFVSKRRLGRTDLFIEPLVLGTKVFGWTADEKTSFAVLDALVADGAQSP